jgi:hypothetical protein
MLPTITKADLGDPTEPGEYAYNGATVRVDAQHLEAWHDTPDAAFKTILCTKVGDTSVRLVLGGFHLG